VAGVEVILDGLDLANHGDLLAGLGIASLTPVRVDLFGLAINSPGTIVSGGPNSHALGVQPIPEPGATVSFLSGFLVVGLALRQHAHTGR